MVYRRYCRCNCQIFCAGDFASQVAYRWDSLPLWSLWAVVLEAEQLPPAGIVQ